MGRAQTTDVALFMEARTRLTALRRQPGIGHQAVSRRKAQRVAQLSKEQAGGSGADAGNALQQPKFLKFVPLELTLELFFQGFLVFQGFDATPEGGDHLRVGHTGLGGSRRFFKRVRS